MAARTAAYIIILLLGVVRVAFSFPCRGVDPSWPRQYRPAATAAASNAAGSSNSTGPYCVQLSDNITLQYVLAYDTVLFDVQAVIPQDTAYLGLGLSELGSMKGADIAVFHNTQSSKPEPAAVNGAGSSTNSAAGWQLVDSYAPGFVTPKADSQQDLKLLSVSYTPSNNTFSATWVRPLVPCDATQDLPLAVGMPIHIIWAYADDWGYHGPNRGGKLIKFAVDPNSPSSDKSDVTNATHATDLLSTAPNSTGGGNAVPGTNKPALLVAAERANASTGSDTAVATDSSNSTGSVSPRCNASGICVLDLAFPVDIPPKETTYRVMYFKLPDDRKYHIVKYEPIVNHPMLHHGVGYSCLPSDVPKVEALPNLGPYDRLKQGMLCEQFLMTLAANMTAWEAPPVAGMPFGANSTRYVALELHYNNPEELTGQKDVGSGIRVYYTPKLRDNDVGVLTLGQFALEIPPGKERYAVNTSVCPSGCTSRFRQPIQLLSGFFHMHDLGKEIIARHYRNGRELTSLGHIHNFDYAYQSNQDIFAPDAKVLLPGDSLTVQCIFDSTSRKNVTRSGPGTRDEMCFYWISYFPAQEDMSVCVSIDGSKIAACGADVRGGTVYQALQDRALFANLTAQGTLLQFPGDPATNSTPYLQQCSNLTVV